MIRSISHSVFFSQCIFLTVYFSSRYISGKYNKINQLLLTKRSIINEGSFDNCRKNGISEAFISLLRKQTKQNRKHWQKQRVSIWEGEGEGREGGRKPNMILTLGDNNISQRRKRGTL